MPISLRKLVIYKVLLKLIIWFAVVIVFLIVSLLDLELDEKEISVIRRLLLTL